METKYQIQCKIFQYVKLNKFIGGKKERWIINACLFFIKKYVYQIFFKDILKLRILKVIFLSGPTTAKNPMSSTNAIQPQLPTAGVKDKRTRKTEKRADTSAGVQNQRGKKNKIVLAYGRNKKIVLFDTVEEGIPDKIWYKTKNGQFLYVRA